MTDISTKICGTLFASAIVFAVACGSSQTTTTEATAEETAAPPPKESAAPTPVPTETASAAAPSASATSSLPPPSGAPALSFSGSTKIQQPVGRSPAAKFELSKDHAIFRVPEYAITGEAPLVTFMADDKAKKATGGSGTVFRLFAQIPPAEEPTTVTSAGPAFVLELPVAKGVASPNLAVGEITKDDKGKETVTWKVIAPKSNDNGVAKFEITTFTNDYLQVTTAAATPAP